jgi:hypothetical protein
MPLLNECMQWHHEVPALVALKKNTQVHAAMDAMTNDEHCDDAWQILLLQIL